MVTFCLPYSSYVNHTYVSQISSSTIIFRDGKVLLLHRKKKRGPERPAAWYAFAVFVQLLSQVWLFVIPRTAAHQVSLSSTISQSLLKFMSIESVIPSNRLILCCPLLLLPSIFPSIRVFSRESALCIRWLKYCSFSFSPSSEYSGLISLMID